MTVDNCGVPSGRFEKAEAGVPSRGCHSERNDRRERSRRIFALTHCTVKTRCEDPSTRFRSLRMTRWVDFVHWPYFSTLDSHCQLSIKNNTIRWMVLLFWGGRGDSLPFAGAKVRCCRCPAGGNAHPAGVCIDLSNPIAPCSIKKEHPFGCSFLWGGRWDSNPRSSEPQSDALAN